MNEHGTSESVHALAKEIADAMETGKEAQWPPELIDAFWAGLKDNSEQWKVFMNFLDNDDCINDPNSDIEEVKKKIMAIQDKCSRTMKQIKAFGHSATKHELYTQMESFLRQLADAEKALRGIDYIFERLFSMATLNTKDHH